MSVDKTLKDRGQNYGESFAFGFYCIDKGVDLTGAAAFIFPILSNTAVFIHGAKK